MNLNYTFIKKNTFLIEYFIFILIISFPLFYKLGNPIIELWDESRNANNAIEMLKNHNYIVRYFNGSPDMWEVKPPLLIWFQVICFKFFGINEFALRFPSAFFTFALINIIIYFFHKEFKLRFVGYTVGLIIVSSQGYIDRHIARTGDHDATLVFFIFTSVLCFYKYITSNKNSSKYLIIGTIFLLLGTLTKSIVSIMFLPGIFVFLLYKKKFISTLKNPYFYISLIIYIGCIGFYYLYREYINPGYLKTVWNEELFPRYGNSSISSLYYINNFFESRFVPWIFILPFSIVFILITSKNAIKDLVILLSITGAIYLYVISNGSKNLWYDALLYPIFAIIISLSFYYFYTLISSKYPLYKYIIPIIFGILFIFPYTTISYRIFKENDKPSNSEIYSIPYFLRNKTNNNKKYTIIYNGYDAHILFYSKIWNQKNKPLKIKKNINTLHEHEYVIASEKKIKDKIENLYDFDIIEKKYMANIYYIKHKK